MTHTYKYQRPMVTVDAVIFRQTARRLELLVVRRGKPPFMGKLALPGGFVEMDEDLVDAARRELHEETGIGGVRLEQLAAFGKPGRDPRGRNICVAFAGVLRSGGKEPRAGDDASEALWVPARRCNGLAFDHDHILRAALRWFAARGRNTK